jgi:hypothetical protein
MLLCAAVRAEVTTTVLLAQSAAVRASSKVDFLVNVPFGLKTKIAML